MIYFPRVYRDPYLLVSVTTVTDMYLGIGKIPDHSYIVEFMGGGSSDQCFVLLRSLSMTV